MTLRIRLTYIGSACFVLTSPTYENPAHPVIRGNYIRQFRASLLDSTNDREDAASAARWNAGGVEHVHALFPGRVALRLRLRPRRFTLAVETPTHSAARRTLSCIHQPADWDLTLVGELRSTKRQPICVVVAVPGCFRRSTFLHRLE